MKNIWHWVILIAVVIIVAIMIALANNGALTDASNMIQLESWNFGESQGGASQQK